MRRRQFLAGTAAAAGLGLAGCLGILSGNSAPPPRRSDVVSDLAAEDGILRIALEDDPVVESRADVNGRVEAGSNSRSLLAALSPVGVAAAKGKGGGGSRGATGRASGGYSSAPKTRKGRAKYWGGGYADDWRDDHDDELRRYDAEITAVGVAYLGPSFEFRDDKPGPGPVPWDRRYDGSKDVVTFDLQDTGQGWYRVGTRLRAAKGSHDFRWEAIDSKVERNSSGFSVAREWKVSPRL